MVVASVIGTGRMGAWFASFLKKNGYEVNVYDRDERAAKSLSRKEKLRFVGDLNRAAREAQLIIFATPTRITKRLLEQIQVKSNASIVEISSVKTPIKSTIVKLQKKGIPILSIHPMFGPGAKTIAGRVVLTSVIPTNNRVVKQFLSLLERNGAKLIQCSLKDHDKLASIILALPHFINIVFVNSLRALSVNPDRMRTLAGTTFKLQLLVAEAIYQEGTENEVSILVDNAHSLSTLKKLAQETASLLDAIENRKTRKLVRTLANGNKFISKDRGFSTSYSRFNEAVEVSSRH
ncbi:MAG TPA: prephenate dehydrogenase [Candidatus Bathyarchaeia archaeon]|nr:prephenate dehydrogenase [Candidatus Bathyarchaeia archaeon]